MTSPRSDHLPTWPEIRQQYPELAARLRDGDLQARVEFVRIALGGTIVEIRHADGRIEHPDSTR
jgi:hypothetical protein